MPTAPSVASRTSFTFSTTPPLKRDSLAGIDRQLDLFHSHSGKSDTYDIHIFYLVTILNEIQAYRVAKAHKILAPTANFTKRNNEVNALEASVFLRIRFEQFEKKKAAALANGFYNYVPLGPGYANERTIFQSSKGLLTPKDKAINPQGGSFVHQSHSTPIPLLQTAGMNVTPSMQAILQKNFDTLTVDEYKRLWKALPKGDQSVSGHNPNVHFARKEERVREHLIYADAGLYYKTHGTAYGNNAFHMYAMDKYGNLMVARSTHVVPGGQYNHSSLNAGNDVICAGETRINQGRITLLNNNSGHYAPSKLQMQQCVMCLIDDDQADLSLCALTVYDHPNNAFRRFTGTAEINTFYNNVNAPGNVVAGY